MNELIVLFVCLCVFEGAIILYGVIGILYHKLILHSKKSITQIISEL